MIVEIHSIQSGMAEEGEITFWKCGAGINCSGRPHKQERSVQNWKHPWIQQAVQGKLITHCSDIV